MKVIELDLPSTGVADLFNLAGDDDLLIRLPNGKIFMLTSVTDEEVVESDFSDEIARTRQNSALMALLRERGQEKGRVSSQEARKRLGLE